MKITHSEVRQQLAAHLSRLWRYGMVLSRNRDVAEELVQSTCLRAPPAPAQHRGQVSRRALIAASLSFLFIGSGIGYFARPESASRRESGRRLLRYDDASIAQIVWDRASEGPMALCISREQHQNLTPVQDEKRHGMNLAWWHAEGYQYVLIGRSPTQQMQQRAGQLRQSLS